MTMTRTEPVIRVKPLVFIEDMAVTAFGTYAVRHRVMKGWEATFYPMVANVHRKHLSLCYAYKQTIGEYLDSRDIAVQCINNHWSKAILEAIENEQT